MAALISIKVWVLFIALRVVVVVGSPTMDLLESVDCLLRDWLYAISRMLTETTIDSVRNERLTGQTRLISSCDNVKDDLERLLEQIDFSSFLSLAQIITFSPPRTRPKPPRLEALYYFPPFTL